MAVRGSSKQLDLAREQNRVKTQKDMGYEGERKAEPQLWRTPNFSPRKVDLYSTDSKESIKL